MMGCIAASDNQDERVRKKMLSGRLSSSPRGQEPQGHRAYDRLISTSSERRLLTGATFAGEEKQQRVQPGTVSPATSAEYSCLPSDSLRAPNSYFKCFFGPLTRMVTE